MFLITTLILSQILYRTIPSAAQTHSLHQPANKIHEDVMNILAFDFLHNV